MRFGSRLRTLRTRKGLGLRELAKKANISAAFLSKIESGKEKPPAEEKLHALAKALNYDSDVLMAEAGRLPADIIKVIQKCPQEYLALLRELRNLSAREVRQVRERIPVTFMDIPISPEEMENFQRLFRRGPSRISKTEIHFTVAQEKSSPTQQDKSRDETKDQEE